MTALLLLCCLLPDARVPPQRVRPARPAPLTQMQIDLARFPGSDCAYRQWRFTWQLELYLVQRQALGIGTERTRMWLSDVRTVKAAWDALDDAHRHENPDYRRQRFEELRQLLGEDAWWRGQMPELDLRFFEGH